MCGLQLIGRYDRFTPNNAPSAPAYAGATPSYDYWVVGASYDVTQRFTMAVDWQVQHPRSFPAPVGTNVRPTPRASTMFLHWQAAF
jgi:hypothetical protein